MRDPREPQSREHFEIRMTNRHLTISSPLTLPDLTVASMEVRECEGDELVTIENRYGHKLGIMLGEDGMIRLGGWNEEGEWVDLSLVTFPSPGHMAVIFPLNQYQEELD